MSEVLDLPADEFAFPAPPPPSDAVRALDRLVGTWTVTGEAVGTVTFEWMDGGYFLLQRIELEQFGQRTTGLEVIGHLRPFGEGPSADVHARYFDDAGNTLDYVYEIEDDTLHIWGGEIGFTRQVHRRLLRRRAGRRRGLGLPRGRRLPLHDDPRLKRIDREVSGSSRPRGRCGSRRCGCGRRAW